MAGDGITLRDVQAGDADAFMVDESNGEGLFGITGVPSLFLGMFLGLGVLIKSPNLLSILLCGITFTPVRVGVAALSSTLR